MIVMAVQVLLFLSGLDLLSTTSGQYGSQQEWVLLHNQRAAAMQPATLFVQDLLQELDSMVSP